MNIWTNTIFTEKGLALMSKLTQGVSLKITKAAAGAGFVTPGMLVKETDITDQKQELAIQPASYPETGKCAITVALKNEGMEKGYTATQVGLFAEDPDEGEILLIISQSTDADTGTIVPSETEMAGFSSEWTFYLHYGQADGVSVTVDPAGMVTRKEMEEYVAANGGGKRASRLTIGTSTNGWTKKDCDYLCDGTADDVEINNAIAALPSTGGEIVILDGTYNITAQILLTKANTTLSGNGASTILVQAYDADSLHSPILISQTKCTVRGLYIDIAERENFAGIHVLNTYAKITDNTVINNPNGTGIYIGSALATVNRNVVSFSNNGIYVGGTGNNIITENFCRSNISIGINIPCDSNIVSSNNCINNNVEILCKGKNNIIENNQVGTGSVSISIQVAPIQVTLSSSGWVGTEAPYTYTITGYDGKTVEVVEDVSMTMEQLAAIENAKIKSDPRSAENILYAFGEKPTIDVPVLLIVR